MRKKAQYLAEMAILLGAVVAVIISMQTYMRRSLQAKIRDSVDSGVVAGQQELSAVSKSLNFEVSNNQPILKQYEPYYVDESATYQTKQANREKITPQQGKNVKITQESYSGSAVDSKSRVGFDTNTDQYWE